MTNQNQTFFIDQHGCAKNQVDAELIIDRLLQLGFEQTFAPEEAGLIIVNSCGFIESAKKEALDAVYEAKQSFPKAKIVLAGCLAERYSEIFKDSLPEADAIFGNGDISKIDEIINELNISKRPVKTYPQNGVCAGKRQVLLGFPSSAFVKITEGCSNYCSFCAIPLIRGEIRSRTILQITDEIKSLVDNGIFEINLIGQDLAAFGTGKTDDVYAGLVDFDRNLSPLANLFNKISTLSGDFAIRPLYIHPDHFNLDILSIIKNDKRFLPYFDIPFQSGDDKIILKMNRTGSAQKYAELIKNIKSILPESVIRTTFLAGFPGETDEQAKNTQNFLQKIKPEWSGCFGYSLEEDTKAYKMRPLVPAKKIQKRVSALQQIQTSLTQDFLKSCTGKNYRVLIEEVVSTEGDEGLAIGRSWFQAPEVDGAVVVRFDVDDPQKNQIKSGALVNVKIIASSQVDLDAEFISIFRPAPVTSGNLKFAPELL